MQPATPTTAPPILLLPPPLLHVCPVAEALENAALVADPEGDHLDNESEVPGVVVVSW